MKSGVEIITQERQRQITTEGWTKEIDDQRKPGELTMAAICYATIAASSPAIRNAFRQQAELGQPPHHWPWSLQWWKPGIGDSNAERIRELTKAGALIAAEIDRLQRKVNKTTPLSGRNQPAGCFGRSIQPINEDDSNGNS